MRNTVIYIIGLVGVGKYTIAKELETLGDFRVIGNHLINNVIFPVARKDGITPLPQEVWSYTKKIRDVFLEAFQNIRVKDANFVFTNALADNDKGDMEIYESVRCAAENSGASFFPVRVLVDKEENRKRIMSVERELRFKQTSDNQLDKLYEEVEILKTGHKNEYSLDVTKLSAAEAAQQILDHVKSKVQ
tara:strand:+ start:783 stop:1352 length:570 start_codon:yes stop_codon:yes gene_type:complete